MNLKRIEFIEEVLLTIILIELTILVFYFISLRVIDVIKHIPQTADYLKNCDNLTLYQDGCQVFT